MRIEGNVSIRGGRSEMFGTKVEVKNLNSFRSLERAMEFEVERMTESLAAGVPLTQGDPRLGRERRADRGPALEGGGERLPPLSRARPAAAPTLAGVGGRAPRLPRAARRAPARGEAELGLSPYDAGVLSAEVSLGDYFDEVVAAGVAPKAAANWVSGEFSRLNRHAAEGLGHATLRSARTGWRSSSRGRGGARLAGHREAGPRPLSSGRHPGS